MKNPLASLKSLDYKKFAIDHGEKIALGCVGLVVLLALFMGTRWSPYDGKPSDLKSKADTARTKIASSTWPEQEKIAFEATTRGPAAPEQRVNSMITDLPLTDPRLAWSRENPITWQPLPKQPPITEPQWLKLRAPIADAGRIVIDMPIAPEEETETEGDELLASRDANEKVIGNSNPFAARSGTGGGGGAAGGTNTSSAGYGRPSVDIYANSSPGAGLSQFAADYGSAPDIYGGGGTGASGSGVASVPSGYPTRYVAVRMVFPAREQLKAILDARKQAAGDRSDQLLSLFDFEIERQQSIAGPEKWSKWQKFDLKGITDVLGLVTELESDVLHPSVIDPVITMPLPLPKYGYWGPEGEHATHPLLEKYKMSAGMQDLTNTAANTFQQYGGGGAAYGSNPSGRSPAFRGPAFGGAGGANGVNGTARPKGGFAGVMQGLRGVGQELLADEKSRTEIANKIRESMEKSLDLAPGEKLDMQTLMQLTEMGEFMLFRFIDLDVTAGRAYRYRARIVLYNPHYDWPLDRVVHPSVAEGEFRETEWSDPTDPVIVEPDREFYVARVSEQSDRSLTAYIDLHQWSPTLGSWVGQRVKVSPGDRMGGQSAVETEVIDLVKNTFEKSSVRFETQEVLADLVQPTELEGDDEYHSKYLSLGKLDLTVDAPAIVLDEFGQLVPLDPLAREAERKASDERLEAQLEGYEFLKGVVPGTTAAGEDDPLGSGQPYPGGDAGSQTPYGQAPPSPYGQAPQQRRERAKRSNPLRLDGSKPTLPTSGAKTP